MKNTSQQSLKQKLSGPIHEWDIPFGFNGLNKC